MPIDTEAIDQAQLSTVQDLITKIGGTFDAVVSTDGDSDRPLLLAPEGDKLRFFGGDLLGMIVAEFLRADAVVVPISTNDAIDRGPLSRVAEPKTKIGSPYVIAGMQRAVSKGRQSASVDGKPMAAFSLALTSNATVTCSPRFPHATRCCLCSALCSRRATARSRCQNSSRRCPTVLAEPR